jgi:hypothetical protein
VERRVLAPAPFGGHHHSEPLIACVREYGVLELVQPGFDHGDGELVFYNLWAPDSAMKAVEQFIQVIDPVRWYGVMDR